MSAKQTRKARTEADYPRGTTGTIADIPAALGGDREGPGLVRSLDLVGALVRVVDYSASGDLIVAPVLEGRIKKLTVKIEQFAVEE